MINSINKSLIIALAAVLSACGIATDGTGTDTDPDLSFNLDSVTVTAKSTQVYSVVKDKVSPTFSTLEIQFSEKLAAFDPDTALSLTYDDGTALSGSWSIANSDTNTPRLVFTRTGNPLPLGSGFRLKISKDIKDLAGNSLPMDNVNAEVRTFLFKVTPARKLTLSPTGMVGSDSITIEFAHGDNINTSTPKTTQAYATSGSNSIVIASVADALIWEGQKYKLTITGQPANQFCRLENGDYSSITGDVINSDVSIALHCTSVTAPLAAASQWNDYVQADLFTGEIPASPVVCPANDTSVACRHAGEIRSYTFTLPGKTCSDISVHDVARTDGTRNNLTSTGVGAGTSTLSTEELASSAFEWRCSDDGAGNFTVTSTGLKNNKHLVDLFNYTHSIDPNDSNNIIWDFRWISRKISITDNTDNDYLLHQSGYSRWWSNPIVKMTDSRLLSVSDHRIYVIAGSLQDQTLSVYGSRNISVVALPVEVYGYDGNGLPKDSVRNSRVIIGDPTNANLGNDFIWIELSASGNSTNSFGQVIDSTQTKPVMSISHLRHSVIRNVSLHKGLATYADAGGGSWNYVEGGIGLHVLHSHLNRFEFISSYDNQGDGVEFHASVGNTVRNVHSYNNNRYGVRVTGTSNSLSAFNKMANMFVANNGANNSTLASPAGGGIKLETYSNSNFLTGVQSFNNLNHGIEIAGNQNSVSYGISANNSQHGMLLGGSNNLLLHTTLGANSGHGLSMSGTHTILGNMSVNNNGAALNPLQSYGTTTFDIASYGNTGADCSSSGTECSGISLAVTAGASPVSPANNDTSFSLASSAKWNAGNALSSWGNFNNGYGRCVNETDNDQCVEHDWSLLATSIGAYGFTGADLQHGYTLNEGTGAPTALNVDYNSGAQEIIGDHVGNDNGLCETGETCNTGSSNYGAYQGSGL